MNATWLQLLPALPPVLYAVSFLIYRLSQVGDGTMKRLAIIEKESELLSHLPEGGPAHKMLTQTLESRVQDHQWKATRRVDGATVAAIFFILGVLGPAAMGATLWAIQLTGFWSVALWILAAVLVLVTVVFLIVGFQQFYKTTTDDQNSDSS